VILYGCKTLCLTLREEHSLRVWLLSVARTTEMLDLSPVNVKNLHFSMSSRPALGPTEPPIRFVSGTFYMRINQQLVN
jgi:hypothetical protein